MVGARNAKRQSRGAVNTHMELTRYTHTITDMHNDPDLIGDLLLIGMHWAAAVHLGTPPLDGLGRSTATAIYGAAFHGPRLATTNLFRQIRIAESGTRRVWDVIRSDIRRYTPNTSRAAWCQRPIRRRTSQRDEHPGDICGRPTAGEAHRPLFTDPTDGTRHSIGCCSRPRCVKWWQDLRTNNQAELATAGEPPTPVANSGGILARHLPELDWHTIYRALDPRWVPPPEVEPWRPPTLRLVIDVNCEDDVDVPRPNLSVIRGGW